MDGDNKGGEAQVSGFDPAHWDIVKDDQGNVTVSPKQAADGCNGVDVVIGPGNYGPGMEAAAEPAPIVSTRPFPEFGHVLCQVCKRPTNSEVQNDIVDTPYVFLFKGQPRAIICFECYTNGIISGAFHAIGIAALEAGGGEMPLDGERSGAAYIPPVNANDLPPVKSRCEETGLPL